jgi:quercetin dioxygenase-like cupin family protein/DNA-binding XRE family transcriptional regulator
MGRMTKRIAAKRAMDDPGRVRRRGKGENTDPDPASDDLRIGLKLKHSRLIKRLRLTDVAAWTGLSESLISKVENNKTTPSLSTLHLLTKAYGTNIAALFDGEAGTYQVVMRRGQRPILSRLGTMGTDAEGTETELLIPFGSKSLLQATLVRVEPGGGSLASGRIREHQGDEVGYIVRGSIKLQVGSDEYRLDKGDAFFFPSHLPHGVTNIGNDKAEIVWVSTPPSL